MIKKESEQLLWEF